jgi:xylan 1,4-beta-xylosidase
MSVTENGPTMPERGLPPFAGNISFNAQHAPMGAFFSFTCGHFGTRGGFGVEIGRPGNQDLYIGVKDGDRFSDGVLKCLPFYEGAVRSEAERYAVEQAGPAEQNVRPRVAPYAPDQITRRYGWSTDRWDTGDFAFMIHTPFGVIPEPGRATAAQMREVLCPAVTAELVVENRSGHVKTGFFALNFHEPGWHPLENVGREESGARGFAWRGRMGVVGRSGNPIDSSPFLFCRWTVDEGLRERAVHRLGTTPGIGFEVPPGQTRRLRMALGVYLPGIVTTGIEGRYLYTRYFSGLGDVLDHALTRWPAETAAAIDEDLAGSGLSANQQFLIAHATRSYYGSTQLLDVGGEPMWVVNEGEYCMMNTLDLSVDQMFWELKQSPWVVRNLLDRFVRHYSYVDEVKDATTGERRAGGISFCHDMGAHNNFSPFGHSSYELPDLTGCFSYMTAEQLCNWVLIAATYVIRTGDRAWMGRNGHVIEACLRSLVNRGGEAGFCLYDSARCGSGSEITTYDSLDHSLAQTRGNLYMAVKTWAAYVGIGRLLGDEDELTGLARRQAERVVREVVARAGEDGVMPAVFEAGNPGHGSRILPAVEGLLYPFAWGEPIDTGLREALRRHVVALLKDPERRNVFADGGIRLSSTSDNSWMSKIAIFQQVARRVLGLEEDAAVRELFVRADGAHVKWQTEGESAYWACSDQMVKGVARASRYYPRVITTALWME